MQVICHHLENTTTRDSQYDLFVVDHVELRQWGKRGAKGRVKRLAHHTPSAAAESARRQADRKCSGDYRRVTGPPERFSTTLTSDQIGASPAGAVAQLQEQMRRLWAATADADVAEIGRLATDGTIDHIVLVAGAVAHRPPAQALFEASQASSGRPAWSGRTTSNGEVAMVATTGPAAQLLAACAPRHHLGVAEARPCPADLFDDVATIAASAIDVAGAADALDAAVAALVG